MSYKKREKAKKLFMGPIITPKNRKKYFDQYLGDYLKRVENSGNPDKLNAQELSILGTGYANLEIQREKKHLKAHLKGFRYYKHKGQTYPVLTPQVFAQQAAMNAPPKPVIKKEESDKGLEDAIENLSKMYSTPVLNDVGKILMDLKEVEEPVEEKEEE